jgi:hypothetical protein
LKPGAGEGKARKPAIIDGGETRLFVSTRHDHEGLRGLDRDAGAIDVHVDFDSAGLVGSAADGNRRPPIALKVRKRRIAALTVELQVVEPGAPPLREVVD